MPPLTLVGPLALVGHFLLWAAVWNQVTARNLPPRLVRLGEKAVALVIVTLPLALAPAWFAGVRGGTSSAVLAHDPVWSGYLHACAAYALLGTAAGMWRRWTSSARHVPTLSRVVRVRGAGNSRPVAGWLTRACAAVPGNQICDFEVNEKRLEIPQLPAALEGLTIAHISDLHLTGRMTQDFYAAAFEATNACNAELVAITGDIVDKAICLDWIPALFPRLRAPSGVFYILGNHDKRIAGIDLIHKRLGDLGFMAVGGRWVVTRVAGGTLLLAGNELPWLGPAPPEPGPAGTFDLRLALLHSPDQFPWARQAGFQLALAGHTHGGQIRLPFVGAIVTPSRYGPRYACGVFHERPTVMHVSRGVSALHPLRFGCRPEISKLVLRRAGG